MGNRHYGEPLNYSDMPQRLLTVPSLSLLGTVRGPLTAFVAYHYNNDENPSGLRSRRRSCSDDHDDFWRNLVSASQRDSLGGTPKDPEVVGAHGGLQAAQ
eukprot:1194633-Prorocentrum_minimum.AAC.21